MGGDEEKVCHFSTVPVRVENDDDDGGGGGGGVSGVVK
jgi:hypothetical protein